MPDAITKKDVFLYFANRLDRPRRLELERASQSDPRVRRWFEELRPTEEELLRRPPRTVRLDRPEDGRLAAVAYRSVERDEEVRRWVGWVRDAAGGAPRAASGEVVLRGGEPLVLAPCLVGRPFGEVTVRELLHDGEGALLYREPAPLALAADAHAFSAPPVGVPIIHPDYAGGRTRHPAGQGERPRRRWSIGTSSACGATTRPRRSARRASS